MEEQGVEETKAVLNKYRNCKDSDIQDFLANKALIFEERKWCNTYLIVDEDTLACQKEIEVEAYFTLSNKIVEIHDSVSKTLKRKLFHGLNKRDANLHVILIGQLGKYYENEKVSEIHLSDILDYALSIATEVDQRVACSCLLLEYETSRTSLRKIYEEYGFQELQKEGNLTQMYLLL